MHVVLLGDSTLDNASYTEGGPAVVDHLVEMLNDGGRATLLALDGAMTTDMADQVAAIPADATHVFLSVGGNDAMMRIDILTRPSTSVWDALTALSEVIAEFETAYRECLAGVLALGLPTVVCTIYNGAFQEANGEQTVVSMALRAFNDSIIQTALDHELPVVDLRRVCSKPSDFANPIEPNVEGGRKIAAAIVRSLEAGRTGGSVIIPSGRSAL